MNVADLTHIVDDHFDFLVLASHLPDKHLDEVLEGGCHVYILVLQLSPGILLLHLLYQPGHIYSASSPSRMFCIRLL